MRELIACFDGDCGAAVRNLELKQRLLGRGIEIDVKARAIRIPFVSDRVHRCDFFG
jgi:hypothetical protein